MTFTLLDHDFDPIAFAAFTSPCCQATASAQVCNELVVNTFDTVDDPRRAIALDHGHFQQAGQFIPRFSCPNLFPTKTEAANPASE